MRLSIRDSDGRNRFHDAVVGELQQATAVQSQTVERVLELADGFVQLRMAPDFFTQVLQETMSVGNVLRCAFRRGRRSGLRIFLAGHAEPPILSSLAIERAQRNCWQRSAGRLVMTRKSVVESRQLIAPTGASVRKIAACILLAIATVTIAGPAYARTHRNAEARAADKRAKEIRKAQKEQAKAQQKAMKQAQKDQLKRTGH
jgi:hypothetical protein